MSCKIILFLYRILPLTILRSYIIEHHFSTCRECDLSLSEIMKMSPRWLGPGSFSGGIDLWPGVRKKLETAKARKFIRRMVPPLTKRRITWTFAFSLILIFVLVIPAFLKIGFKDIPLTEESLDPAPGQIMVQTVKVDNQPAQTITFQPSNKNRIIVWVKRGKT